MSWGLKTDTFPYEELASIKIGNNLIFFFLQHVVLGLRTDIIRLFYDKPSRSLNYFPQEKRRERLEFPTVSFGTFSSIQNVQEHVKDIVSTKNVNR